MLRTPKNPSRFPARARRRAATSAALIALLLAWIPTAVSGERETRPPNIIFVLVDDLRWDTFGHLGYPIHTPEIDRLAREGVRFENAFVASSLCSPSRVSFLTGVYPHVHGVTGNQTEYEYGKLPLLSHLLKKNGYRTAMIGKWHIAGPADESFGYDHWFLLPGQGDYENPLVNENGHVARHPGYATDILTEHAAVFIRTNRDRPFFLHLAHKSVDAPRTPAPRHRRRYKAREWPRRPNQEDFDRGRITKYAETLLAVDESLGRIQAVLEETGLLDDTLIVFTSDNGFLFGEHGFRGKRVFYEESIRVPWIMWHPRSIAPGSVRTQQVLNIDLMPTLLELAGIAIPDHVQGRSLVGVLRDPDAPWRSHWLYEYFRELPFPRLSTMVALRTERFKYVEFPEGPDLARKFGGDPLLFDLRADPFERKSVANDPAYAEARKRLAAELRRAETATGFRTFPLDPSELARRIEALEKKSAPSRSKQSPAGAPPE